MQPTRWVLVLIATAAGFAASFNFGKVAPTLLLIRDELQTGLFEMGLVVSVYSMLAMLLAIPMGLLIARFGAYRMALLALTLLGCGALTSSQADSLAVLLIARVLEGFGYVMIAVAAPALIALAVNPKDRPVAMGIWAMWLPLGISLMFLAAPLVIVQGGWRNVWLLTGIFPLLWLLVLAWGFRQHASAATTQQVSAQTYVSGDWRILLQRGPLLLAASFCCFAILFIVAATFLPTAWQQTKDIPIAFSAFFMAFAIASHGLGNLLGGWLIGRGYPAARVLCTGFVLPAALIGFAFVDSIPFWWQYGLILACMFIQGLVPGTMFATAPTYARSPRQISLLIGLVFQGAATGQVLGPILFSTMIEWVGGDWNYAVWFFAGFAALGGMLMWHVPKSAES